MHQMLTEEKSEIWPKQPPMALWESQALHTGDIMPEKRKVEAELWVIFTHWSPRRAEINYDNKKRKKTFKSPLKEQFFP